MKSNIEPIFHYTYILSNDVHTNLEATSVDYRQFIARNEIIICKRELSKYDSNDYAAIPHLSDEHKNLVIESWDFVSDFVSEVGVKKPLFLFITDYIMISDSNITN